MQDIFILAIKKCSNCQIEKLAKMFPTKGNQCKKCQKEKRQALRDKKQKYDLQYRFENKEKLSQQQKIYDQKNKVEVRKRKNKYVKQRRIDDPIFRMRHYVSKSVRNIMKLGGVAKGGDSCLQYMSFSMDELKAHLEKQFEPWMNWNNQGKYNSKTWNDNDCSTWTWQIDHIIPQSDLPYISMSDDNFKKCWSLDNLRPLSAKQNLIDGVTKVRHKQNTIFSRSENV